MKMFRTDARKENRRRRTEEEIEQLRAWQRQSPGKVSRTMRMTRTSTPEVLAQHSEDLRGAIAPSMAQRRWAGPPVGEGAFFGTTRASDADSPMLGNGPEAMSHLACRPEAASMQAAARSSAAPIQGKGIDHLPTSKIDIEAAIEASGSGEPLPEEARAKMEAALGMDFSTVRIHVGPQAARVGALAFTRGTDIFFAPGQYQPWTRRGLELLGHELTHVVQQAEGRVTASHNAGGVAINDDSGLEREADEMGRNTALNGALARSPVAYSKDVETYHQPRSQTIRSHPLHLQRHKNGDDDRQENQSFEQMNALDQIRHLIDSGVSDFDLLFQTICQHRMASGKIDDVFGGLRALLGKNRNKLNPDDQRRWDAVARSTRAGTQFNGQMDKLQHFVAGAWIGAQGGENAGWTAGWLVEKFDTVKALWGDVVGTRQSWQVGFDWDDFEWTAAGATFGDLFTDLEKTDRKHLLDLFANGTLKASQIYQPANLGIGMQEISPAFSPFAETNIDKVEERIDAMVDNLRQQIKRESPQLNKTEEDQLRILRKVFVEQDPAWVEWFFRRLGGLH